MDWQGTGQAQRLWPVIPVDDWRALSPAICLVFNVWAIVLIALPYSVVLACGAAGWMAISAAYTYTLTHTGLDGGAALLAVAMRCVLLAVTVRLEWVMLGMLPWIIREARDCFNEAVGT